MPIDLTTPEQPPARNQIRLTAIGMSMHPERRIICDYVWGFVDADGNFTPDLDRRVRRVFDADSTPSLTTFLANVLSAATVRRQTETYIRTLEGVAGTVT